MAYSQTTTLAVASHDPNRRHTKHIESQKLCRRVDMSQKMAKIFTFGRKHKNWYTGVFEGAYSKFNGTHII